MDTTEPEDDTTESISNPA
jgi:hypothetical protein